MRSIFALAVAISVGAVTPTTPAFNDWDRSPSGHQPYVAHSPDGTWQLEVDPLAQELNSTTVLRLVHDGVRTFEKREKGYPDEVCLSNEGTLLLTADHQHVRVLGTNGTEIATHAFDALEAGDGRSLSITDWTFSPDLDAFCIVFCASSIYGDVQVSMKPTIGTLALVDARTGVLTRALDPWPPSGVPHTIVAVPGTRVLVVAYTRLGDKSVTRDQLLVLDGGDLRGTIDSPVEYDGRHRQWNLASDSAQEFTVCWPGESVVRHWKVTESSSGPTWHEAGSEPVATVSDSPSVSLSLVHVRTHRRGGLKLEIPIWHLKFAPRRETLSAACIHGAGRRHAFERPTQ